MKRLFAVLVVFAVVGSACDGSDSTSSSSTVPPVNLTLPEYLAEILEIELRSAETQPIPPNDARLMAGYSYEVADRYRQTLVALEGIVAPAEAALHAANYRAQAERTVSAFSTAAEAWLAGEGIEDLQERMLEVAEGTDGLGEEFRRLLTAALEADGSEMSRYLLASISLRDEFAATYVAAIEELQPLFTANEGTAISEALVRGSATFDGFLDSWDALNSPSKAAATHRMQRGLITTISAIFTDVAAPLAAGDTDPNRVVAERMNSFVDDATATTAAFNELMIEALRSQGA